METEEDKTEGSTALRNFGLLDTFLSDPTRKAMCENDENCESTTESMPPNVPIHYICPTTSLGVSTQSPKSSKFVILQTAQPVTPTVVYQSHSEARDQSVAAVSLTAWKHEDEVQLIKLRMQFNNNFLGEKSTAREGWEKISMNMGYGATQCRKKWEGILKKYKTLKVACETTPEGSETVITWRAYEVVDDFLGDIIHDDRIDGDTNETDKINWATLSELIREKQEAYPRCIPNVATVTGGNRIMKKHTQKRVLQLPQQELEEAPLKVCVQQKSKKTMESQSRRKREPSPSTITSQDHCAEMMAFLRETTERERRDRNRILNIIENILSATTVESSNVDNT